MSTFVGIRGAASELDLSKKSSHRNNGRRTGSFKNLFMNPSQDDVTSTESTPTNKNANNNRQLLRYCDVAQSPDYRTFLMMRRPPTKIPRRFSDDYDSAESDTSDCSSDDCVVSVETENNLQHVSPNPRTSNGGPTESPPPNKEIHISKRNSDKALAQLN
uniref:Uncharacterized protein n=1 Tax=Ciona savignyi TaxID=51511 RepID=H2YSW6_CIOSA